MDPSALAALRRSYALAGLDVVDVDPDPFAQFDRWLTDSVAAQLTEPNAMVLATADASGRPRARTVLLKGVSPAGFTFFTNTLSTKGQHLDENPQASLCFPWIALERQVVVVGDVERLPRTDSAEYFRVRPRGSQLGALASRQSQVITSRDELIERYAALADQYPGDSDVPVPDDWGGYRVTPTVIEFWQGRANRLHDRVRYRRSDPEGTWVIERLSP
jgi:pyridoxamine 5'-phosphate oxidase